MKTSSNNTRQYAIDIDVPQLTINQSPANTSGEKSKGRADRKKQPMSVEEKIDIVHRLIDFIKTI